MEEQTLQEINQVLLRSLLTPPSAQQVKQVISLESKNSDITYQSLRLLQKTIPVTFKQRNSEKLIDLLPQIINCLGSIDTLVSRTSMNCIALLAKNHPQPVIEAIKVGLHSNKSVLKRQCLRALNILKSKLDSEILEQVIELINDPVLGLTALHTARTLIQESPRVNNTVSEDVKNAINQKENEIITVRNQEQVQNIPSHLPDYLQNSLAANPTGQSRIQALQLISNDPGNLSESLAYLKVCIDDVNRQVNLEALKALNNLLNTLGITRQADFFPLMLRCLSKLGEERIKIRKMAYQCVLQFLREYGADELFPQLIKKLESSNWHEREETLNVFIYSLVAKNITIYYDFIDLVRPVSKLLQDNRSKLRFVALEAIAVFAEYCGRENVLERIIGDQITIERVKERLKKKQLPAVNHQGDVMLPKAIPQSVPVLGSQDFATNFRISTRNNFRSPIVSTRATPADLNEEKKNSFKIRRTPRMQMTKSYNFDPVQVKEQPIQKTEAPKEESPKESKKLMRTLTLEMPEAKEKKQLARTISTIDSAPVKVSHEMNYLKQEELKDLERPQTEIEKCINQEPTEWTEQFEILNMTRRLLKNHASSFDKTNSHNLMVKILRWADSLRSSLSKNSLIVLQEMFIYIPKLLDQDLDTIVSLLLRKSTDTNQFISETAQKALIQTVESSNENKIAQLLIQNAQQARSGLVKAKVGLGFKILASRMGREFTTLREFNRILQLLANLIAEASVDVRNAAKSFFRELNAIVGPEMAKYYRRVLSYEQIQTIQEALSRPDAESPLKRIMKTQNISYPRRQQGDNQSLGKICLCFDSKDWKQRMRGLQILTDILEKQKKASPLAIECLIKCIDDQEERINIQVLSSIISLSGVEGNLEDLIQPIIKKLESQSIVIRDQSFDTCKALARSIGADKCLPLIVNTVVSQDAIHLKNQILADIIPQINEIRPSLLHKHLIPYIKSEGIDENQELANVLSEFIGNSWI